MRVTAFGALSLLLLSGAVAISLRHAGAQDAPPPAAQEAPPPPPSSAPPAPAPEAAPAPTPQAAPAPTPQGAPAPAAAAAPAAPASAVTHRNVNLRGGPGTNYALLRFIRAGSSVEVKECKHGWCEVVFQGADGYIIESSISESRIASNPSGTAARPRYRPMPGYVPPPPAYNMRLRGYYPPPYRYYYYGPYYRPYWAWRRAYWGWW